MHPYATTRIHAAGRSQQGVSLIELMISITIGLILLVGITSLIMQQSSTRDELDKSSREIENGRYAMQILHDDIEHAGFYGTYTPPPAVPYAVPVDPCVTTLGSANSGWDTGIISVPTSIYGYPGAAADPTAATTCGLLAYKPNTAILVIRRTATATVPATPAPAAGTYIQASECNTDTKDFAYGTAGFPLLDKKCINPAPLSPYMVNVYYISTCNVCAPSDNIPTLKMVQSGPAAAPSAPIPLVEGIENMQFDYGIDSSGDGAPETYTNTPAMTDWPNVMTVRVYLLARNIDPTLGYSDSKTYNLSGIAASPITAGPFVCGAAPYPQLCNYKRHVYSELVRAINPSGRREAP